MKNSRSYFILMAALVLLAACSPESIAPSEEANLSDPENASLLVQLEEGFLTDQTEILAALDLTPSPTARYAQRTLVYTLSNEISGNKLIAFEALADGTLSETGRFPTNGTGTDGGLGNQSALTFNQTQWLLYTVNPGSNEISFFVVPPSGTPIFINKVSSGGTLPVSITEYNGLIYVLNAGSDEITGFTHNAYGWLVPIPNSTRPLSGNGVGAAQIAFNRTGRVLIVTEKNSNTITTFRMRNNGRPAVGQSFASAGAVPFGFDLGPGQSIVVSEAGGTGNGSTASTYRVNNLGQVTLLNGPIQLNTAGACWVTLTGNRRHAFVTNTATDNITSLAVSAGGTQVSFANNGNTIPAFDGPLDAAFDMGSEFMYVLAGGNDAIISYELGSNGALTQIDLDTGLPDRSTGLVVKN